MKKGSSSLFSYFKPVSSQSPSTGNGTSSKTPSSGRKPGGQKKQKTFPSSASKRLEGHMNGASESNPAIIAMETEATETKATPTPSGRKRPHPQDSDESEEEIGVRRTPSGRPKRVAAMAPGERQRARRRAKRSLDSEDSEEEYCPGSGEEGGSDSCSSGEEEREEEGEGEEEEEEEEESIVTPAKKVADKPRRARAAATPKTPASRKSIVKVTNGTSTPHPSTPHTGTYLHDQLNWLKMEHRMDKSGRTINDPDYNPRTLKVPPEFLKAQSPAMRQWWKMKSDNFDTILMFKVGKFYELYHMDAVIGVQELGLVYMKGEFAHSGFPEIAFGRYAQTLVQKGYKVARVEQTETPQMMEKRVKRMATPTRHDKVVRREICNIVTKGTCTLSFSDGVESNREAAFLLAVKEKAGDTAGESIYGVCFVDTSIGQFHLGEFHDDWQCSRLRTVIAHHPPAHFLYEKNDLSSRTKQVLKQLLGSCVQDALAANTEFWDSHRTLKTLAEGEYFSKDENEFEWPEALKDMIAEDDSLGLTASDDSHLAISALGACVFCLKRCLIDRDILSLRSFMRYKPLDLMRVAEEGGAIQGGPSPLSNRRMVLDDITLNNLDVMDHRGRLAGTLLERLDHCTTAFGRRLLTQWVTAPLCDPRAIHDRLDAVTTLMTHPQLVGETRDLMKTLPDLQRLLRQIHGVGIRRPDSAHPDNRAIMYEEAAYSKRKITGFLSALEGFKTASRVPQIFAPLTSDPASLLKKVVTLQENGGRFPDMEEQLHFFSNSFDIAKAKKEGTIIPARGVNPAYDAAMDTIKSTASSLDDYLKRQRKRLGCSSIVYWGSGRNRFQLEVPESALARHIPDEYELKSQKKGVRRYWTREIERYLEVTMAAEEDKQLALKDTMRTIFHSFVQHFHLWESAVQCLSTLDVLISLTTYSSGEEDMCCPLVVDSPVPFLDIRDGRHPCVSHTYSGDVFVPNDVIINGGRSQDGCLVVVVTGPNMGGKSTLIRQTGLIVILAQLGCYVPASSCTLSPVDRVFTRIGASDRITSGESTFFVELSETATILHHATPHSLVLLDELGRGTATYDGTAIASAVLRELAEGVACRTLFSTHYHSLVDGFHDNLRISFGHMACMVENEEEEGEREEEGGDGCKEESITFLYKFIEGVCPKSYGFNAAKLAGLPSEVIRVARRKAREFEENTEKQKLLRQLVRLSPLFPLDQVVALQTHIRQLL